MLKLRGCENINERKEIAGAVLSDKKIFIWWSKQMGLPLVSYTEDSFLRRALRVPETRNT